MTDSNALEAIRDRIKGRNKNYRIETGRDLIEAKTLLPHGEFGAWLKDNFNWSESTAQNFMNAARLVDKSPEVAILAPSAVIALAAPNTPETVKSEVVAGLFAGKVPTLKEVKAKIAEARAPRPQSTKKAESATVRTLPIKDTAKSDADSARQDLVERLRAAGLEAARTAFEAAFPGYVVTDYDELEAEIARAKAA